VTSAGLRVHGLREVNAAFRKIDSSLAKEFGNDLKKAAAPVVETAKAKETRWRGASINTIRAKRSGPRVFVEQSARKKTGLRGDFGALQMRSALEPALEENTNQVFTEVERVLNHYASSAGF
jgi:hypothetical protein